MQVTGWIAPNGKMYECSFEDSEVLAGNLTKVYFGEDKFKDTEKYSDLLYENGFVLLMDEIIVVNGDTLIRFTESQRDTIKKLPLSKQQNKSYQYYKIICDSTKDMYVITGDEYIEEYIEY